MTPSEVASILGLDLIEVVRAVPFEQAPFRPRAAPRAATRQTNVRRIGG